MSTLKATNIKNESSASNNIVLDSGGGVVVSGVTTVPSINVNGNSTSTKVITGISNTEPRIQYTNYNGGLDYKEIFAHGFVTPATGTTRTWTLFQRISQTGQYARISGELLVFGNRHSAVQQRLFMRYAMLLNYTGVAWAGSVDQLDYVNGGLTASIFADNGDSTVKLQVVGANAASSARLNVVFRGVIDDTLAVINCTFDPNTYVDT